MKKLTIGTLAHEAGMRVSTVRFYERAGLLAKPARSEANYRIYPPETVVRLRFIHRAQELGFTLVEIGELLNLRVSGRNNCASVRARAAGKIADIKARIHSLQRMRRALEGLASQCATQPSGSTCPILQNLNDQL